MRLDPPEFHYILAFTYAANKENERALNELINKASGGEDLGPGIAAAVFAGVKAAQS